MFKTKRDAQADAARLNRSNKSRGVEVRFKAVRIDPTTATPRERARADQGRPWMVVCANPEVAAKPTRYRGDLSLYF